MENRSEWKQRWRVLGDFIQSTEQALPSGIQREWAIRRLLRGLRGFGHSQLCHYLAQLDAASGTEPEAALHELLAAASLDLDLLEHLAHQRAWGPLSVQAVLEIADRWADAVLRPGERWLGRRVSALTGLRGRATLRLVPYGPYALVGLAYGGVALAGSAGAFRWRGLLEVPYAVGRCLFQHGQIGGEPVRERLRRQLGHLSLWGQAWLEGVFAHTYALLVAGPVVAVAYQDAALELTPEALAQDSDHGPPPLLAPKVQARALERLNLDDWAASLCNRWRNRLHQRGWPATVRLSQPVTELRLEHPRDELIALADAAGELLQPCAPGPAEGWRGRYAGLAAYAPFALEVLYTDFERHLEHLPPVAEEVGGGAWSVVGTACSNWLMTSQRMEASANTGR